jgi:hypothetical protein
MTFRDWDGWLVVVLVRGEAGVAQRGHGIVAAMREGNPNARNAEIQHGRVHGSQGITY